MLAEINFTGTGKIDLTYRLEYRRAPSSWEGDPAPSLVPPIDPAELFSPDDTPKGDLIVADVDKSLGELRPDIGWVVGM